MIPGRSSGLDSQMLVRQRMMCLRLHGQYKGNENIYWLTKFDVREIRGENAVSDE